MLVLSFSLNDTPWLKDDGQIEKAAGRFDVGNIAAPGLIRLLWTEVPIEEIRGKIGRGIRFGGHPESLDILHL